MIKSYRGKVAQQIYNQERAPRFPANEEFLKPMGISQYRLAVDTGVPPRRINEIVHGKRGISANTALRLSLYFGTSAEFRMNLQSKYDLEVERDVAGAAISKQARRRRRITTAEILLQKPCSMNYRIESGQPIVKTCRNSITRPSCCCEF